MTTLTDLKVDINLATSKFERQAEVAKKKIHTIGQQAANSSRYLEKMGGNAVTRGLGNVGNKAQQVSYQLQDMVVQAQGGVSAFTILGQQGPQLASAFGPAGAVYGAIIALSAAIGGTLVASMLAASDQAEAMQETITKSIAGTVRVRLRQTEELIENQKNRLREVRAEIEDSVQEQKLFDPTILAERAGIRRSKLDDPEIQRLEALNRGRNYAIQIEAQINESLKIRPELLEQEKDIQAAIFETEQQRARLQKELNEQNGEGDGDGDDGKKKRRSFLFGVGPNEIEGIRQSLLTVEQAEIDSHARRVEQLELFMEQNTELRQYGFEILEQENQRHEDALTTIKARSADKQAAIEKKKNAKINAMSVQTTNLALSLATQMAGGNKKAAIAIIGVETALNMARTTQSTAAATMRAYADLGPKAGSVAAAKIQTLGNIQLGIIAAAGALKAGNTGSSSSGTISSENSSESSLPATAPEIAQAETERPINIIIHKDFNGEPTATVEEQLDKYKEFIEDSDYVFISKTSRNGQELS